MNKRTFNIILSILVAGLFIWLAVQNVNLSELWSQIKTVTFYWYPFFLIAMLFSHFLRAVRWRLLLKSEDKSIPSSTLFAGVMLGYVVNNLIPRLGEISRPVYVAKKAGTDTSNLLGTIVFERLFDLATMLLILLFAILYLVSDLELIQRILGIEGWSAATYLWIPVIILVLIAGIILFYKLLVLLDEKSVITNSIIAKIITSARSFGEGMVSLKNVKNWPLFLILTAGIWGGYIIMTYLPFYMLNLQAAYGVTLSDAVVLTLVSSVGVSIPTPAGVGSYHLLMQQAMWLLYDIPLVTALTYATVVHATTVLTVFAIGPVALWWDKYYTLQK